MEWKKEKIKERQIQEKILKKDIKKKMAKEYQEQQDKLSEQSTCFGEWLENKKINTIKKLCSNDDFYQCLLDITDRDYTGAQQVMKYLEKAL